MPAVGSLCRRAFWLDRGRLVAAGETRTVVEAYLQSTRETVRDQQWTDPEHAPGGDEVRLRRVRVFARDDPGRATLTIETPLRLEFEVWNYRPDYVLNLAIHLNTIDGACAFVTSTRPGKLPAGLISLACDIPGNLLNDGSYSVTLFIGRDVANVLLRLDNCIAFEIADVDRKLMWFGKIPGVVRPNIDWFVRDQSGESRPISLHGPE
jgi:lipopolysaccharide transport system ATP-binding protein